MITVPKLEESDLLIFRNKQILICGFNEKAKIVCDIFKFFEMDVLAFWDSNLIGATKQQYRQVPVVTTAQLQALVDGNENVIAQSVFFDRDRIEKLKEQLQHYHIAFSPIEVGLLCNSFYPQCLFANFDVEKNLKQWENRRQGRQSAAVQTLENRPKQNRVLICLPQKTGDYTLMQTFDLVNQLPQEQACSNRLYHSLNRMNRALFRSNGNKLYRRVDRWITRFDQDIKPVDYVHLAHRPKLIHKEVYQGQAQGVKVITAIRDPIAQNLSSLYQLFTVGGFACDWALGGLVQAPESQANEVLQQTKTLLVDHGDDVQMMFDAFVNRYVYSDKPSLFAKSIQQFITQFSDYVIDFTKHPFNKEKGYAIIKDGNLEVFVYQLEKLDQLVTELSDFIGVPFDQLVRGNDAADKWIADSYKQAQKDIKFSPEYFNKCFDEAYVQHCYSQTDIEKFKVKWRSHVQ